MSLSHFAQVEKKPEEKQADFSLIEINMTQQPCNLLTSQPSQPVEMLEMYSTSPAFCD